MVAERFNISRKLARRDVIRVISEWKSLGLLTTATLEAVERQHGAFSEQNVKINNLSLLCQSPAQHEHHYRLLDAHVQIRYPCQNTEMFLHPIFAHLEVCPDNSKKICNTVFDIAADNGGYVLLKDRVPVSYRVHILELASVIKRQLLITAYQSTDCLVAIHAAAVCNGKRSVLLPGTTGSGKSTLTAALIGSGLTYLTDELTLLMPNTHNIRSAPVSLCLKRGSWSILASTYSVLETLPIHFQEGKEIRYLPPPDNQPSSQETYSVEYLVFPRYVAGEPTSLKALGTGEALYRVAEAGYAIPGQLNKDHVEDLIGWIAQLDCYELQMDDLGEAAYKIKELLA